MEQQVSSKDIQSEKMKAQVELLERELAKSQINQRRAPQLVAETDDDVKT